MKVLIINGSPRPQGNTKIALDEMVKIFDQEGIEVKSCMSVIKIFVVVLLVCHVKQD